MNRTTGSAPSALRTVNERLKKVQRLLLDPCSRSWEESLTLLNESIGLLQGVLAAQPSPDEASRSAARTLRTAVRHLKAQIEHARRFHSGWLQLVSCSPAGYTDEGTPPPLEGPARLSCEG